MRQSDFRKILISVSILSVLFFVPSHSAQAIEYGGFGGRPAYPRADNPRTESIFVHTLLPGTTQAEGVLVVNNSQENKTLLVYGADSTPSSGGAFACEQLSEEKNDVGAWITLATSSSEIILEPGTNIIIPFTIAVPSNASVGEHNGCILIQEKKDKVEGQTGAVLSVRTGLRVVLTIPGDIIRKLEIVNFTKTHTKDSVQFHPFVKNTGNVSIDANTQVVTRYFFGLTHATHGGQYPILRDDTSEWNFELPRPFWGGWFRSSLTVSYDESIEASVGVTTDKRLTVLTGPSLWFFSFPKPIAAVIEIAVLLILIFCIWFLFYRKKKKDNQENFVNQAPPPQSLTPASPPPYNQTPASDPLDLGETTNPSSAVDFGDAKEMT